MSEQSAAAACLESNGSFNYIEGLCDMQQSHQYSPFMARNTLLVNSSMLIALIGCIVCIMGLYQPRK